MVERTPKGPEFFGDTVVIARFASSRQAKTCQVTLSALFRQIKKRVRKLYEEGGGQADLEDVSYIYSEYGLTNENGWEQEHAIMVSARDVAWPLSHGIRRDDVEDLLATMEPQSVEFHDFAEEVEQWRLYPIPEIMPIPDFDVDEDMADYEDDVFRLPPKRVIH